VFIPKSFSFELRFILGVIYFLENIFESSIIFFHNGVFSGEIQRIISIQCIYKALISKFCDWIIQVIHGHSNSWTREVKNFISLFLCSRFWCKNYFEFASFFGNEVGWAVLVTKSMSSDHNRFFPLWNQKRNVFT